MVDARCIEARHLDAILRAFNIKPTRRRRAALGSWLALHPAEAAHWAGADETSAR
jgi:hypothetical protein